jgi:hypothetical protein
MVSIHPPFHPIIYVRGYAGNQSEVEETVATPYMGFNLGSVKVRQRWTGRLERVIFESPLIRLMKDHNYRDIYLDGAELPPDELMPPRSVIIYRYYEPVSKDLGTGERPEISVYADGLSEVILKVRDHICGNDARARKAFRVHLVAHSMGGLICRTFLQNPEAGTPEAKKLVDKVFTYATPHNGIDMALLGNVPGFFSRNNANNFNRSVMAQYLGLAKTAREAGKLARVDDLAGGFDPQRFFCLVGTNWRDYEVGGGWVARLAGPMSDGLVRIDNATVRGCPRAFVHRSHSGHYGIVNSEEGYQNLVRFLFGDVRIDGVLHVNDLTLPDDVQKRKDQGRRIRASYHFETVVAVRGAGWDLHRRMHEEGSAVFRTYEELFERPVKDRRHPHLFSAYLSRAGRVNPRRPSLGFAVELRVLVPQYEVNGVLFLNNYFRGGHLYQEKINIEAIPPRGDDDWRLKYGFDSESPNETRHEVEAKRADGALTFTIPITQDTKPGIDAELQLTARPWV